MNLIKLFRKSSKFFIILTTVAFIVTTFIGLLSSYADLFF